MPDRLSVQSKRGITVDNSLIISAQGGHYEGQ